MNRWAQGFLVTSLLFWQSVSDAAVVSVSGTIHEIQSPAGTLGSSVDHWKFSVTEMNSPVEIDVLSWEVDLAGNPVDVNGDGEFAFIDTYIFLFRDDGLLDVTDQIIENDGGFATLGDGSVHYLDSYIATALEVGNYILAIGSASLTSSNAIGPINPSGTSLFTYDPAVGLWSHDHGDYRITFTGDLVIVPEPANGGAFAIAGVAFALRTCRHRRQRTG